MKIKKPIIAKVLICFTFILFAVAGCKKEISKEPGNENVAGEGTLAVASRLINNTWIFTSVTLKYDNGDIDNDPLDNCKSDDIYKYDPNGAATLTFGSIPCNADPANGKYADWELIDDGTRLKEIFTRDFFGEVAGSIVIYDVDFISHTKLIISRIITEPGKNYTEINTYIRP